MTNAKTGSFTLEADGIYIETNGLKFKIGYEQTYLPFDEAKKWCAERGGDMFSFEQGIFTAALRAKINKALEKAGKTLLDGWYWLNRENPAYTPAAYVVNMNYGYVHSLNKDSDYYVRAVSAL